MTENINILRQLTLHFLSTYDYKNAQFMCEILAALDPSENSLHFLATTYLHVTKPNQSIILLKGHTNTEENKYLLALCEYSVANYNEAEQYLIDNNGDIPFGGAGLNLLGRICERTSRIQQAIKYYKKSLELDPFLWTSFSSLCELGEFIETSQLFHRDSESLSLTDYINFKTPKTRKTETQSTPYSPPTPNPSTFLNFNTPLLSTGSLSSHKKISKKKRTSPSSLDNEDNKNEWNFLYKNLQIFAKAYSHLCKYECNECISILNTLNNESLQNSPWVLSIMGRCYFELCEYNKSIDYYKKMRKIAPHYINGLEYYSTALWHLRKQIDLSYLANQLVDFDRLTPETWITVGNCFSLQKDHNTALLFFKRAIQVDPYCAYAYTLSAHEYLENEDCDNAFKGYRQAVHINDRHYNAWYGLGSLYLRQEKYDLALIHFQRAISINNRTPALHCYIAKVYQALGRYDKSLESLSNASELSIQNPLVKFQRAQIFVETNRLDDALKELELVSSIVNREAAVELLIGDINRKLGNVHVALKHYTNALDCTTKDKRNAIKTRIDSLDQTK